MDLAWPEEYGVPPPPEPGWMSALCRHYEATGTQTRWMVHVQNLQVDGQTWSCATEGRGVLFLADHGEESRVSLLSEPRITLPTGGTEFEIKQILKGVVKPLGRIDLLDLIHFTGPYRLDRCGSCREAVDAGQSIGCEECDYTGVTWPNIQAVRVLDRGYFYDPNQLALHLMPLLWLGVRRVRCGYLRAGRKFLPRRLVIESIQGDDQAPQFRAVITGMYGVSPIYGRDERTDDNTPRYIPGLGGLWHLRDGFEGPLIDWITEQGEDPDEVLGRGHLAAKP